MSNLNRHDNQTFSICDKAPMEIPYPGTPKLSTFPNNIKIVINANGKKVTMMPCTTLQN